VTVGGVDDEHVDAGLDERVARSQASPKYPIAAPTSSRPWASLLACGNCSDLTKSLTVMSPAGAPGRR
jgi:hypothetical protein